MLNCKKTTPAILLFAALFFFAADFAAAQTTGKIRGRVLDQDTGDALPGANILVEGTNRGSAADANGDFTIINIQPGTYDLRVQMIGYSVAKLTGVRVSVNRTAFVEAKLKPSVIEGEEVVVTASQIAVKKDQTASIRNVSSDQIEILPVESVGAVVSMQAGVVNGHFRGGRFDEVSYLVDGLQVDEPFGGGGRTVDLETESVQDLEVITGTFNAEYGRAMSGVVNAVTKEGGRRFNGSFSADAGEYFSGNSDIWLGLNETRLNRNQDYKASFSGPILKDKLTFFTNFRFQENENHLNGIRRFNVDDFSNFREDNPELWISQASGDSAIVPMGGNRNTSFMGKVTANLFRNFKTSFLYTRNDDRWDGYNHGFKYNPDGTASSYRETNMYSLQFNHLLTSKMFYELKFSYVDNFSGWYLFEDPTDPGYVHDLFLDNAGPGFFTGGQQKGHTRRWLKDTNIKFDMSWQIHKEHSLKWGVLFTGHDIDNQESQIRNTFFGTEDEFLFYEPTILPDSTIYSDIYRVKPREFSAYFQDKMEFDEMVLNVGVRYDYFDPNTVYPSQRRNPANQLDFPDNPEKVSTYPKADPQVQLSPRLGLSYQLSDAALLRFSYGHFFQMPPMYALYQNHSFRIAPTNYATTMGNAQLDAQRTVQYEMGLWQQLMPGMGLEIALFYRDIYDLLSASVLTTFNQIRYGLYSNKDYGNVKGLELKYDFLSGRFSSFLNYTLQFTRGNADNPTQTFNRAGDSKDPVPRLIPMSWDQRHTLNLTAGYNMQNYGITTTLYFDSGSPYTFSPVAEDLLARVNLYPNNAWKPSKFSTDITAHYTRQITGGIGLRFTAIAFNIFDRLNENGVHARTGRAYRDIITDSERAGHRSNFNTVEDRSQNPSMFAAPRYVKFGVGVTF